MFRRGAEDGSSLSVLQAHALWRHCAVQRIGQKGWEVLSWMTPYKGCVDAPTDIGDREVLLLRNARDQYGTCRLLDIKIGEVTAVGGWQGKGHFVSARTLTDWACGLAR